MTFHQWLRHARGDWSQQALADAAIAADRLSKVYQTRISEWEQQEGLPSFRQLVAIFDGRALDHADRTVGEALWKAASLPARLAPDTAA